MRINIIQSNKYPYMKNNVKVQKNAVAHVSNPIKMQNNYFTSLHNISFGSGFSDFKPKKSTALLYKDMGSILHDEVMEAKQEVMLTPVSKHAVAQKQDEAAINLSSYPLKQRLILKKYANNPNLKILLEMPKNSSNDSVIQSILGREISLSKKYGAQTWDKFIDSNSSNDEKLKAFALSLVFLSSALKNAKPGELKQILTAIADFKDSVDGEDSLFYSSNIDKVRKLFDIAQTYWRSYELPQLMDEEFQKMIFIEQTTKKYDFLQNSNTYINLGTDEKYFVARYFDNQKGSIKQDDPMVDILSNRTIMDTSSVIHEMVNKIQTDENDFMAKISSSYDFIQSEEGIKILADFNLSGRNSDDSISLLDLYLLLFDRSDLVSSNDYSKISEFLNGISFEQLDEANATVIEEWNQNYLPAMIDKEAAFKAYETDVDTQIIKELKQINENLGHIIVKLDDISLSLSQIISNMDRIYAKLDRPNEQISELQQKNSLYIEAMKSGLENMTSEQAQRVMQAFKTDGIKYLDTIESKTTNPQNKVMINNMRQTIYRSNNPMSVVSRLEGYAPILFLNQGITLGRKAIMHGAKEAAKRELIKKGMESEVATQVAAQQVAAGSAAMSAGVIAATAVASALVVGMYGIYKASNTHEQFSDLYFGE